MDIMKIGIKMRMTLTYSRKMVDTFKSIGEGKGGNYLRLILELFQ